MNPEEEFVYEPRPLEEWGCAGGLFIVLTCGAVAVGYKLLRWGGVLP